MATLPATPKTSPTASTSERGSARTTVVNFDRREAFDVYVGRPGRGYDGYFGNKFRIGPDGDRRAVIERFRIHFLERLINDPDYHRQVETELPGKRLACHCAPDHCHADVYAIWCNALRVTVGEVLFYKRAPKEAAEAVMGGPPVLAWFAQRFGALGAGAVRWTVVYHPEYGWFGVTLDAQGYAARCLADLTPFGAAWGLDRALELASAAVTDAG